MSYRISFRSEAELEMEESARWYEKQRLNLGYEFLSEVENKTNKVQENPFQYVMIYKSLYRVVVNRFPFNIFYIVEGDLIIVVAILHGNRHPKNWKNRIIT